MLGIASHDNQCGIDLIHPPSTRGKDAVKVFTVPCILATAASLAQHRVGRPVTDFQTTVCDITPWPVAGRRPLAPDTGCGGGVVEDVFTLQRQGGIQFATNVGLGRRYVTGWYGEDPAAAQLDEEPPSTDLSFILTHEANYHPDGGQIFSSRDGQPFVLLLAPPGDDITPESFVAFFVDPGTGIVGVHADAGVWHQPAFPAANIAGTAPQQTLDNRQGRVHACVSVSFVEEFGGYMRVPLRLT